MTARKQKDSDASGFVVRTAALVPESEFSPVFVQAMYDRMAVSFFKYGKVKDAYPAKVDAVKSLIQRLVKYCGFARIDEALRRLKEDTTFTKTFPVAGDGNTEWLVDAGNFALIEFLAPAHKQAHFQGTDAGASPGRVTNTGVHTEKGNRDLK